jgi:hypothetical protein
VERGGTTQANETPSRFGGELFAIDGCKLPSNAAKEWSGTLEEPGKKKKDT